MFVLYFPAEVKRYVFQNPGYINVIDEVVKVRNVKAIVEIVLLTFSANAVVIWFFKNASQIKKFKKKKKRKGPTNRAFVQKMTRHLP